MDPTALNLLTAALSQTGFPDGGAATGTAGQTDAVAGLFQSVLASAVTQATATAATQVPTATGSTNPPETGQTGEADLMAQLLGLLEQATDEADRTEETAGVNPELLSQLLAALGVNAQAVTPDGATPTDATSAAAVATDAVPRSGPIPTPQLVADANPAGRTLRPGITVQVPTPTPVTARPTEPTVAPTTVPLPAEQRATVPGAVPQTVTVSDATQVAGRSPSVVAQVPIVVDPSQHLPRGVDGVETAVAPPVNEPTPVKGLPPVTPGGNQAVDQNQNPTSTIEPAAIRAVVTPQAASAEFKLPVGDAPPAVAPSAAGAPQNAGPTGPATTTPLIAGTAQNAPPAGSTAQRSDLAARLAPAQPAPTAPVRPATPEIAITAAQPVGDTVGQLDFTKFAGVSGVFGADARPDDVAATDKGTVVPAGAAPFALDTGRVAPQVVEKPAEAAVTRPPVADQLSGPITAHLRTRPTDGETELQIRLDPPELGAVKLKIVSTGGDVRAELHLSSDAVRRVVESQLPELRQRLEDAGVKVERFDLTSDSNSGTARDDRGDRWNGPPPVEPPLTAVRPRQMAVAPSATGRIDVSV
jgi:flagellar hook-length control protein FliK